MPTSIIVQNPKQKQLEPVFDFGEINWNRELSFQFRRHVFVANKSLMLKAFKFFVQ